MDAIRLLTVTDGSKALNYIEGLLKPQQITVVQTCTTKEVLRVHTDIKPDVTIVDISWPFQTSAGLRISKELLSAEPDANLIGITTNYEKRVEKSLKEAGVKGYIYYEASDLGINGVIRNIITAIKKVAKGEQHYYYSSTDEQSSVE